MSHEITADWDTLLTQAKETGQSMFWAALRTLEDAVNDERIESFTAADVIALAGLMATDFRTTGIGVAAQKICAALEK